MVHILMVCLGNICRSPLAEGALRHVLARDGLETQVQIDSAGTAAYHIGKAPDARGRAAARAVGFTIDNQRARQVRASDFSDFDLILAMDRNNLENLMTLAPTERRADIRLFLSFHPEIGPSDMPDPYYGDDADFAFVRETALETATYIRDALIARQLIG